MMGEDGKLFKPAAAAPLGIRSNCWTVEERALPELVTARKP